MRAIFHLDMMGKIAFGEVSIAITLALGTDMEKMIPGIKADDAFATTHEVDTTALRAQPRSEFGDRDIR